MDEEKRRQQVVIGLADVASFDHVVDEYGFVGLVISRDEIERMETGRAVAALMALTDSEQRVRRFASRLMISFDGYDEDQRALWQIKPCVEWFAAVHAQWPYWLHFLCKHPNQFGFVLHMLAQQQVLASDSDIQPQPLTFDRMKQVALGLFVPMNTLYETFGIGLDENKRMTEEVVATIEKLFA